MPSSEDSTQTTTSFVQSAEPEVSLLWKLQSSAMPTPSVSTRIHILSCTRQCWVKYFITMHKTVHHWTLFWSTCIQATSITSYSHHQHFQYFFWVIVLLNYKLNFVYKLLTTEFCHPVTSLPSGPNILLGILFWNYLRKYSSLCSGRHFHQYVRWKA